MNKRLASIFSSALLVAGAGTGCKQSAAAASTAPAPEATLAPTPFVPAEGGGGVVVLGFGGTIAGKAEGAFEPEYAAGGVCLSQPSESGAEPGIVDYLLDQSVLTSCEPSEHCDVPGTGCRASRCGAKVRGSEIEVDFCDIERLDSSKVTPANWLTIAQGVQAALERPEVHGVVITHGTDTLEETAYLLDLVLNTDKPVVIAAAMRASNHLSADGYMNLMNAVSLAASPEAEARGVLVVLNDTLFAGRSVTKRHTTNPAAFVSTQGAIGEIYFGGPRFYTAPTEREASEFGIDTLRSVIVEGKLSNEVETEIIYEYAGGTGGALRGAIGSAEDSPIKGIVVASSGNGGTSATTDDGLKLAAQRGLYVAISSRTGVGEVTNLPSGDGLESLNSVTANDLSPQQARVLMILGLSATKSCVAGQPCLGEPSRRAKLQSYFNRL